MKPIPHLNIDEKKWCVNTLKNPLTFLKTQTLKVHKILNV